MTDPNGYLPDPAPGEQGEHIAELQQRLQDTGFHDGPLDGVFGEQTQAALEAFGADRNVAAGQLGAAVVQLAQEAPLAHAVWQQRFTDANAAYPYAANLQAKYRGEEQPDNTVWAAEQNKQTYYPDAATAEQEYHYDLDAGRFNVGEVDAEGNPILLDTVDIETRAGLVGSQPERMIYSMGTEGDFRLVDPHAEKQAHPGERIHHSTLTGGEAVAGAGEMKIREGVPEQVSDRSGHFKPDFAMTQQVDDRLVEGGVDTSRVTYELTNFDAANPATQLPDTRATGTEVGSYNRENTLHDLKTIIRGQAEAAAETQFGAGSWQWLSEEQRAPWITQHFDQLWAPIEALDDRALAQKARELMEQRHTAQRSVLADIPTAGGWREDPSGRHQWRWIENGTWVELVSDNDVFSEDIEGAEELNRQAGAAAAPPPGPPPAPAPAAAAPPPPPDVQSEYIGG